MATATSGAIITFPSATADWTVDITAVGIYDAATGGNLLWARALSAPVGRPLSGAEISISAGSLDIILATTSGDATAAGGQACLRGLLTGHYVGLLTGTNEDARQRLEITTAQGGGYARQPVSEGSITYGTGDTL